VCIDARKGQTRPSYDAEVTHALETAHVDLVLCAGWMRVLGQVFTDPWEGCCFNLHLLCCLPSPVEWTWMYTAW
jgi:folate-dependent phosphoribosylglycinamide formyltransferase PurN